MMGILLPFYSYLIEIFPYEGKLSYGPFVISLTIGAFPFSFLLGVPYFAKNLLSTSRKHLLLLGCVCLSMGALGSGFSLILKNYYLLLFSRLFSGFFAANAVLCLFELSPPKKGKSDLQQAPIFLYGLITSLLLASFFLYEEAFWIAFVWGLITCIIVSYQTTKKVDELESKIFYLYPKPKDIGSTLTYFYFFFAFWGSIQFFPYFLSKTYSFPPSFYPLLFLGLSIAICIGFFALGRRFVTIFPLKLGLYFSLAGGTLFAMMLPLVNNKYVALLFFLLFFLYTGIVFPFLGKLHRSEDKELDRTLTLYKIKLFLFAAFLSPLIIGLSVTISPFSYYLIGLSACISLICSYKINLR